MTQEISMTDKVREALRAIIDALDADLPRR